MYYHTTGILCSGRYTKVVHLVCSAYLCLNLPQPQFSWIPSFSFFSASIKIKYILYFELPRFDTFHSDVSLSKIMRSSIWNPSILRFCDRKQSLRYSLLLLTHAVHIPVSLWRERLQSFRGVIVSDLGHAPNKRNLRKHSWLPPWT